MSALSQRSAAWHKPVRTEIGFGERIQLRYAIASDIHGSAYWCEKLLAAVDEAEADQLVLLGDILNHGPRNALPKEYAPAEVARLLNERAATILSVRGNCDSEVDQMMLAFPCLSDYALIADNETRLLCTHGHLDILGPGIQLPEGSVHLSGHTHIKRDETINGIRYLNPGSTSIPKDGSHSFLVYENGEVEFVELH